MSGARLEVRYFAAARERAGCSAEAVELPTPATVAALTAALGARHPALAPLLKHLRVAVNHEFRGPDDALQAGDEVALIPPVAGGSGVFRVTDAPLQLSEVVEAVSGRGQGGVVTFSGAVRDATRGRAVLRLEYEAYGEMAVKQLEALGAQAAQRFGARLAIVHRVGTLVPGELAVVIAASAPHRAEAFAACAFAIEELKRDVPIWKKEVYEDGDVWVGLGP
ncbi:MAG: molybdopterin converting factor subunit 1 [Archangiaceae bacterium]|nr:molybdopterin converting factor subunit 1 [Archangiaceae bacterium]